MSNLYLPKIVEIKLSLDEWMFSEHEKIRSMAHNMSMKFMQYWDKSCYVMSLCFFLDPRYKLVGVEYLMNKLFGVKAAEKIKEFKEIVNELIDVYIGESSGCSNFSQSLSPSGPEGLVQLGKRSISALDDFEEYLSNTDEQAIELSEYDRYLAAKKVPRNNDNFDVLAWWNVNGYLFPNI